MYKGVLDLLEEYHVDLYMGSHVHYYERMGPIVNNKM